jgi:hypothetical protein
MRTDVLASAVLVMYGCTHQWADPVWLTYAIREVTGSRSRPAEITLQQEKRDTDCIPQAGLLTRRKFGEMQCGRTHEER